VLLEQQDQRLLEQSEVLGTHGAALEGLRVRVELRVSVQRNSVDIRDLAGRVGALARLEERVAAIERRLA
jgi:hypothetical protein